MGRNGIYESLWLQELADYAEQSVILQNWEVKGFLDRGTFSRIFLVSHYRTGEMAALKFIPNPLEMADCSAWGSQEELFHRMRFNASKKEAEIMDRFHGEKHVVQYLEKPEYLMRSFKNEQGERVIRYAVLICMPLYQNHRKWMRRVCGSRRESLKLGIDIARALIQFEEKGVFHRDIKPGNVLMDREGNFCLGDVGEAKLESEFTTTGFHGTRPYMAPEVYNLEHERGKMRSDHRSDIYSLGIILYRLFNHQQFPFLSETGTLTDEATASYRRYRRDNHLVYDDTYMNDGEKARILRYDGLMLPPPSEADTQLAGVILKACAYHREDRWQTAKALCNALECCLEGRPIEEEKHAEPEEDIPAVSAAPEAAAETPSVTQSLDSAQVKRIYEPSVPMEAERDREEKRGEEAGHVRIQDEEKITKGSEADDQESAAEAVQESKETEEDIPGGDDAQSCPDDEEQQNEAESEEIGAEQGEASGSEDVHESRWTERIVFNEEPKNVFSDDGTQVVDRENKEARKKRKRVFCVFAVILLLFVMTDGMMFYLPSTPAPKRTNTSRPANMTRITATPRPTNTPKRTSTPRPANTPLSSAFSYEENSDRGITITEYTGWGDEYVTIPETIDGKKVTMIGEKAFKNSTITGLSIPGTVKTIGKHAFWNCGKLESVKLAEGIEEMQFGCFGGCDALKEMNIPASISTMSSIVYDSGNLNRITVAERNTWISMKNGFLITDGNAGKAIMGVVGKPVDVVIPDGIEILWSSIFRDIDSVKTADICEGVTSIYSNCFEYCDNLEAVMLPETINEIHEEAFADCPKLKTIYGSNSTARNLADELGITFIQIPVKGERGEHVTKVKDRLKSLGYYSANASYDNEFNDIMVERLKMFQKNNGLVQTGRYDLATLNKLNENSGLVRGDR